MSWRSSDSLPPEKTHEKKWPGDRRPEDIPVSLPEGEGPVSSRPPKAKELCPKISRGIEKCVKISKNIAIRKV